MVSSQLVAETWLGTTLSNDATLTAAGLMGVYSESVPENTPNPYIVWTQTSGNDNYALGMGLVRVNTQFVYIVRAVAQTRDWEELQPFAERIDALLNGVMGLALGITIQSSVREAPYSAVEDFGVVQWRQLGGRYAIQVAAS